MFWQENSTLQRLASEPAWTIALPDKRSNGTKFPVFAQSYVQHQYVTGYTNKRPGGILPLTQLVPVCPRDGFFAYRLRAQDNQIVCLDIEPNAPYDLVALLAQLPFLYLERSQHGGIHGFLRWPGKIDFTVLKDPEHAKAQWELIANRHFITLTGQVIQRRHAPAQARQQECLQSFKAYVELWRRKQAVQTQAVDWQPATPVVQQLVALVSTNKLRQIDTQIKQKRFSHGEIDVSRLEFNLAGELIGFTTWLAQQQHLTVSPSDIINTVARLIYRLYPVRLRRPHRYREKRDGLPWLVYIAKDAYEHNAAYQQAKAQVKH